MRNLSKIRFVDSNDLVLSEKNLFSIPIREAVILEKSLYFFNNPEPCMIHRSAVLQLLLTELESFIDNMIRMDVFEMQIIQLPNSLRDYIDFPDGCTKIVLLLD